MAYQITLYSIIFSDFKQWWYQLLG